MYDTTTAAHAGRQPALPPSPASVPPGPGNDDTTGASAASVASGRYHDDRLDNADLVAAAEDICTIREHLGWQLRATRVLADLLTMAIRDTLPGIGWTVGSVGANLVGQCYGRTGVERRREFQAWCTALGAAPRPERTDWSGITHLCAIATRYDGLVDVVVMADLFPDEEDDQ